MPVAPFQLWLDGAPISSAVRVAGTVTITTNGPHGITSDTYVELGGFSGSIGSTIGGVYQATATSGSAFTIVSAGSAGTAVTSTSGTTEYFAFDILSPLGNYSAAARGSALYVPLESLQMTASGDGEANSISFTVLQDVTPGTPWFLTIPDQTRIRLIKANTGSTASPGATYFRGFVMNLGASLNESGQGTECEVSGLDVNALLDRIVVYGDVK